MSHLEQAMPPQSGSEPGTLIRTAEGRITFWSDELHARYGFSETQALGKVSHELLRSSHWQARHEIEAVLAARCEWRGGLIVYRADDQPVIAANHWYLHRGDGDQGSLVTEVHADIVTPGTAGGDEMADIVTTFAQELSQPLAAIGGFIGGTQRSAQHAWPNRGVMDRGLSEATAQLDRASRLVARLRALGETLRHPRLRDLHAKLTGAVDRAECLVRESRDAQTASRAFQETSAAARQQSREAREKRRAATEAGAILLDRAFALQSIQVYRRRLALLRSEQTDGQAEHLLTQLLREAEMQLAALEP